MKRIRLLVMLVAAVLLGTMALSGPAWSHGKEKKECTKHHNSMGKPLTVRQRHLLKDYAYDHQQVGEEYLLKAMQWDLDLSKALDAITLTKEQEAALVKIVDSRVSLWGANADPITKDGIALKDALLTDNVSEKDLQAASAQLAKDIGESAALASQMVKEARSTLTPEQWAVVKDLINKGAAEGDDELKRLPDQVSGLVGMVKELDLTPDQITYLLRFEPAASRPGRQQAKQVERLVMSKLHRILGHDQMEILKAYLEPRMGRAERMKREQAEAWVEFYHDLDLSQEQLDKLIELVSGKQKEIVANTDAVTRASFALRDQVLADNADPAKIRKAAQDLGNAIGKASLLGADMIKSAKGILNEEQWKLVLAKVGEVQGQIQDEVRKAPDEINAAIKLWQDLDLTLKQQEELKELVQREILGHWHRGHRGGHEHGHHEHGDHHENGHEH